MPTIKGNRKQITSWRKRGGTAPLSPFDFDAAAVAFTPGMDKRAGTVFAAAPIVQGDWDGTGVPDVLSFVRGAQISGHFYENFDAYQGGGVLDWTPEQSSGDRTGLAYFWYVSSNYRFYYDYTNSQYDLRVGGQTMTVAAVVTAGTVEYLSWGFDTNNDIDGTNYAYISRNDAQTYGNAVQPTASAPLATMYIGSGGGVADPNNGIIEGLVFVREIPWNGNFGTDMGQGDIVAAHAAGNDVALSIASWGVTFSMPTDATPGALVTGTGEAHSHPHSSAVLTDTFCETAYGASAWGDENSPITPYSVGFNGTSTSINCGSDASLDDLADGAMTVGAWIRADGYGNYNAGVIVGKNSVTGWLFNIDSTFGLIAHINCATSPAAAWSGLDEFSADGKWHYVEMSFDDAGDRKPYLSIDGKLVSSYAAHVAGVGAIVTDAGADLLMGCRTPGAYSFDGAISYVGIANAINNTDTFVPPSRMNPGVMANRVEQWNFRDGAGAVLSAEVAGANDGTIANGTWNIVKDMNVDAPGQRIVNWGYVFGNDAANEGTTQIKAGLSAGDDFVMRIPVQYERDRQFWPRLQVYDEIGVAEITSHYGPRLVDLHTGGNASATLINANGHFTQSLVGATLYDITNGESTTITAVSGDGTTITGVLSGGETWDTNDVYMIVPPHEDNWVWCEDFACELPAGCTSASWKVLNENTEGAAYVHQAEVQDDLWDDPSFETGTAVTDVGTPTTSAQDAAQAHSGANSWKIVSDAVDEGFQRTLTVVIGKFYHISAWIWADTAGTVDMDVTGGEFQDGNTARLITTVNDQWEHLQAVVRATATSMPLRFLSNGSQTFYVDDVVVF